MFAASIPSLTHAISVGVGVWGAVLFVIWFIAGTYPDLMESKAKGIVVIEIGLIVTVVATCLIACITWWIYHAAWIDYRRGV